MYQVGGTLHRSRVLGRAWCVRMTEGVRVAGAHRWSGGRTKDECSSEWEMKQWSAMRKGEGRRTAQQKGLVAEGGFGYCCSCL